SRRLISRATTAMTDLLPSNDSEARSRSGPKVLRLERCYYRPDRDGGEVGVLRFRRVHGGVRVASPSSACRPAIRVPVVARDLGLCGAVVGMRGFGFFWSSSVRAFRAMI